MSRRIKSKKLDQWMAAREAERIRAASPDAAFQKILPDLQKRSPAGGWALLHQGDLVGIYITREKARKAGEDRFRDDFYVGRVEPSFRGAPAMTRGGR